MIYRILCGVCLLLGISGEIYAARIFIPRLELFIRGALDSEADDDGDIDRLAFDTSIDLEMIVNATSKIGVEIQLGYDGAFNSSANSDAMQPLQLRLISLTLGEAFEDPVYLTIFSGLYDEIGLGDDFSVLFNAPPVYSYYRGFRYAIEGEEYEGLYQVAGSGFSLASELGTDNISTKAYLYNDPRVNVTTGGGGASGTTGSGIEEPGEADLSFDIRTLFDFDSVKVDTYTGLSIAADPVLVVGRGGIMLSFQVAPSIELYSQMGIPWLLFSGIETFTDDFGIEKFQLLVEPRFTISDMAALFVTALVRPEVYDQRRRQSAGFDLNTKILIGQYRPDTARGGLDTLVRFQDGFDFDSLRLAPFFGATTQGVLLEVALELPVVPFEPEGTQIFMSATTAL